MSKLPNLHSIHAFFRNTLVVRAAKKALRIVVRTLGKDPITGFRILNVPNLTKIGSRYGGWVVPTNMIGSDSICYCVGVGEDISFDLGLLKRFNCQIFAFDPTPRAIAYAYANTHDICLYHFSPIGLWHRNEILKFYEPTDSKHVSHSVLNLQKTSNYFEAPCRRLSDIMSLNSHSMISLLKLDIEGAEYKVLESIIEDELDIPIICVEYDEAHNPLDDEWKSRIRTSLGSLIEHGYRLVSVDAKSNYTLVRLS